MANIFGRRADEAPRAAAPGDSAVDSGHQTTVSAVCMRTYFQMRMRGTSGGAEPAAPERLGASGGFTEDAQAAFAQEMTVRAESYVGRQGLGFASAAGPGRGGAQAPSIYAAPQHAPRAATEVHVQTPEARSDAEPAAAGGKRKRAAGAAEGGGRAKSAKPNMKRALRAVMAGSGAEGMKLKLCRAKLLAHFGGALGADAVEELLQRKAAKAGFEIAGKRITRR